METLAEVTTRAVAELLADRTEIGVKSVLAALPHHIQRAQPSAKLLRGAVLAAGWRTAKLQDGTPVYRAPQLRSDPLANPDRPGGNIAADELRLLIQRRERLEEEKKGIADDIKDVMAEAKGRGYDPKAIGRIIAIRRKSKEEYQEEAAILDLYMSSLGMAS